MCDLQAAALLESSKFHRRKFAAGEVFVGCIILPIQGKASRLIPSAGRFRKESMRRRHAFRIPQARINKSVNKPWPRRDERQRTSTKTRATPTEMSCNKHRKEPAQ